MIFVRPYLMVLIKQEQSRIAIPFKVEGEYDECETIAEKIDWLEKYLYELKNIRDQTTDFTWTCSRKNDLYNAFSNEKLYKSRLRMLRKQLKKKK